MFFRFGIEARSRTAGRLIGRVRRELLKAITEEKRAGLSQQELARRLESERSNINRQLSGEAEITLRSLADLAWALGREITFELRRPDSAAGQNIAPQNIAPTTSTIGYQPVRIIAPKTSND
jgi:transcriptional regulator with XRE-family HTH domain